MTKTLTEAARGTGSPMCRVRRVTRVVLQQGHEEHRERAGLREFMS